MNFLKHFFLNKKNLTSQTLPVPVPVLSRLEVPPVTPHLETNESYQTALDSPVSPVTP